MPDYIPSALPELAAWVQLQQRKRADYATAFAWTPTEITRRQGRETAVLEAIAQARDAQNAASAAVAARDQLIQDYETDVRQSIGRDKAHPAYTEAIGRDCGWLAPQTAVRGLNLKPTLSVRPTAEGLRLDWSKLGQDGVQVFRRPAGTAAWGRPLAFDSRSPYIDTETGLSGPYEYYVQLMKDDRPVGDASDIVRALHG
ncbi:hypothetical protein [Hymenobacter sp. B81]|uniref:hypothetical protein n=1 Tax=Hymenobacter sp. B81 TaxID=3344878 RepID=UPI0037DCA5D0